MIERVISGGQSGSDLAGWKAAKAAGIATGGCLPLGWLTEDGPKPEYAALYGATEHLSSAYPARTRTNARESDFTLVFIQGKAGRGSRLTQDICRELGRPFIVVIRDGSGIESDPASIAYTLKSRDVKVLNVAGGRESASPGIGAWVERFLCETFARMLPGIYAEFAPLGGGDPVPMVARDFMTRGSGPDGQSFRDCRGNDLGKVAVREHRWESITLMGEALPLDRVASDAAGTLRLWSYTPRGRCRFQGKVLPMILDPSSRKLHFAIGECNLEILT